MTELEKAFTGENFNRRDPEVVAFQGNVKERLYDFNHARPNDPIRAEIIKELVSGYNQYVFIEDGFHCVFGKNIHFKGTAMINVNCTFLDTNIITIGHCALIGPHCNIICTNHTIDADERLKGGFCDKPITIGEGAVIGAGSVVTKDIPPYTVAVGNPCKVVKEIPHKQA